MTKARDLGDNALNTKPKVIDAKGDLIAGTGADAADRLAVGSNGDTLLADSSQSTGLRWGNNLGFTAGKNKIIMGTLVSGSAGRVLLVMKFILLTDLLSFGMVLALL